jgi:hypothetical protein
MYESMTLDSLMTQLTQKDVYILKSGKKSTNIVYKREKTSQMSQPESKVSQRISVMKTV